MKGILLLNHNENTKLIEEEEKTKFIYSLLNDMGIDIEPILEENCESQIDQKIKFKELLSTYNIRIIDDLDGHMAIYFENEIIGEWNKCEYKLKTDLSELDPKKKLYLEMLISYWSIFEQKESE